MINYMTPGSLIFFPSVFSFFSLLLLKLGVGFAIRGSDFGQLGAATIRHLLLHTM